MNTVSILVHNQLDAQFFFSYIFIPILYMFRAPLRSSSGESIVLIRHNNNNNNNNNNIFNCKWAVARWQWL